MKLRFYCPDCDQGNLVDWQQESHSCDCGASFPVKSQPVEPVAKCAMCDYSHLHLRKDFPRQLGIAIVVVAAVSMWWMPPKYFFAPLIGASLLDLLLFQVVPWKAVCYVCHSEYLGATVGEDLKPYDLELATEYQRLRWRKKQPTTPAADV